MPDPISIFSWLSPYHSLLLRLSMPAATHPRTRSPHSLLNPRSICRLDLSAELFGGVNDACGHNLDRSRCCPVLAAWLFAAHARYALQVSAPAPEESELPDQPMRPDDSQKCVNSLQGALLSKRVRIPQPNAICDAVLCFCGIRLHQISSLSCPASFNVSGHRNAIPTAAVKNLERNCKNSSYAGCTKCLGALQKCTNLAIMYSAHPDESNCSPDQENVPLAVDSLQFEKAQSSAPISPPSWASSAALILPPMIFVLVFGRGREEGTIFH
ncbi:hypothetical protein F3Y22_tig00111833pilonHSYRG00045 [Hibiscus syriacus]|uniref:Uncharacterized protein n=1 Tax=Hibiscus syriacus TaxID=106335 RepID=A0A6A2YEQ4_HIBSY|nr:hypothetical protein F3Y22_tig00111833pilonHSYRG00045 [Hibiscus syriacus]